MGAWASAGSVLPAARRTSHDIVRGRRMRAFPTSEGNALTAVPSIMPKGFHSFTRRSRHGCSPTKPFVDKATETRRVDGLCVPGRQ